MNKLSKEIRMEIDAIVVTVLPVRHDYIPRKDIEFNDFQAIFIAVLVAKAVAWGVPPTVVSDLLLKQGDWDAAWAVAKNKKNRTQTQVELKDTRREEYEPMLRECIQQWVYKNPLVTDAEITECGLPLYDDVRTPSTVPVDAPELTFKPMDGDILYIKFTLPAAGEGSSLKGLPKGVKVVEVVWDFNNEDITPENCRFHAITMKSTINIPFSSTDQGKKIKVFARYVSTTGEKGPWSEVRETIVP